MSTLATQTRPLRIPRPAQYDPNLALLREAARRRDSDAQEFDRTGNFALARRARTEANDLWQHARAVRFDGKPLNPRTLTAARAVLGH